MKGSIYLFYISTGDTDAVTLTISPATRVTCNSLMILYCVSWDFAFIRIALLQIYSNTREDLGFTQLRLRKLRMNMSHSADVIYSSEKRDEFKW